MSRPRRRLSLVPALLLGALLSPVTWKAHLVVVALATAFWARDLTERPRRRAWALFGVCVALLLLPSRGLLDLRTLEGFGTLTLGTFLVFVGAMKSNAENRDGTEIAMP